MKNNNTGHQLQAKYQPLDRITVHDIRQMYGIYSQYYANTEWDLFLHDLSKKTGAFIIRRKQDKRVVGFSTVMTCELMIQGQAARGVFSGDTIIEKEYWGNRVLQLAFYQFLIAEKVRYPSQVVYWLLISKGFKTYLLLANNFFEYYPRRGHHDAKLAEVVDVYCQKMFPDAYDAERQILDFGQDYQHLLGNVAEITDEMRLQNQNIRFFEQCNPEWQRGTELPCVGVFDWTSMAKFSLRYANKPMSKGKQKQGDAVVDSAAERPLLPALSALAALRRIA